MWISRVRERRDLLQEIELWIAVHNLVGVHADDIRDLAEDIRKFSILAEMDAPGTSLSAHAQNIDLLKLVVRVIDLVENDLINAVVDRAQEPVVRRDTDAADMRTEGALIDGSN